MKLSQNPFTANFTDVDDCVTVDDGLHDDPVSVEVEASTVIMSACLYDRMVADIEALQASRDTYGERIIKLSAWVTFYKALFFVAVLIIGALAARL